LDGWSTPRFTPGKEIRSPLYRKLCGPPGRVWTGAENLAPPEFDPRTVQPVASRYTDWASPVHTHILQGKIKCRNYAENIMCHYKKKFVARATGRPGCVRPCPNLLLAYKPSVTRKAKNLLCCCCKEVQFVLLDDNELNIGVSMKQENWGIWFFRHLTLPEHSHNQRITGPTLQSEACFSEMLNVIFQTTACDTERNTNISCYSGIHYWHVRMTLQRNVNLTIH